MTYKYIRSATEAELKILAKWTNRKLLPDYATLTELAYGMAKQKCRIEVMQSCTKNAVKTKVFNVLINNA